MSGLFKYLAVRPNFYISIFVSHGANLISVSNGFPTLVAHTIKNEQESTVVEEFHGEQWMTVGRDGLRETQLLMACHALPTDKNILQYVNKDLAGEHEFPDFHTSIQHV